MKILPQEIEVWYIIPALRKEIAVCLVNDFKYSYEKVGKELGISKPAVSQYVKNKRASKIRLPVKIKEEIMKSCRKIRKGKSSSKAEIIKILEIIRKKNMPCEVCGKHEAGILKDCKEIRIGDYV